MLTRRRFIVATTGAGLGLVATSTRASQPASAAPMTPNRPIRQPDVSARFVAQPLEWSVAGRAVSTWGYGDEIPGRVLRATAGDVVEVTVENRLPEATSIHWHGLAVDNSMDGVPGVTQPDIEAGSSFTYRFAVPHAGTYWFHPHHGLQLERGLYAPLVIEDPDEHVDADIEYVVVLDDWLDGVGMSPADEYERIRAAGAEMGAMPEMDHDAMEMASSPLLGGDAGDARHPYQLLNGRPLEDPATLSPRPAPGSRVRLRVVNASGDTAYRVAVGGHRMTVTHGDGFPVEPVEVDAFLIGMGERYDVAFTVASGAWPVVAVAEGKDQRAAAILRTSDVAAGRTVRFEAAELEGKWLRYADLVAHERARLDPSEDIREIGVALTGGMAMTDWGIDGRRYGDHEQIELEPGAWHSLRITNETSMWHPVHLHGHTAQLGRDAGGVRKDTVNILPGATVELVFLADNPGDWMLHCHNAYHLEAGMASVMTYRS